MARLCAGQSQQQLAEQVAVTQAFVSQLERGERAPTDEVLHALAEAIGVTPEYFAGAPYPAFDQCHFRRASKTSKSLQYEAHARGAFFEQLVAWLDAEVDWPAVDVPEVEATTPTAIERAAEDTRRRWRLRLDEPLVDVVHEVEGHGVVVTEFKGLSEHIDAFSRWGEVRPLIVLTMVKNSTSRCVWDLAHELGHLVLHRRRDASRKQLEAEANRFAGAFLLPRAGFMREYVRGPFRPYRLLGMKKRWKTSVAAIVRRAYDLELMGAREYRGANVWLRKNGWHRGEPDEPELERPALVADALALLVEDVTWSGIAAALQWRPETLQRVTGIEPAAPPAETVGGSVVPFRRGERVS